MDTKQENNNNDANGVNIITYEDFAKLDIRLGTIEAVDIVEDADRLLKLTVNIGETDEEGNNVTRQIVSGIREFFEDPQELVGKQCPFLANLQPRNIKGLESQGMILALGGVEDFSLLHPAEKRASGTKVA